MAKAPNGKAIPQHKQMAMGKPINGGKTVGGGPKTRP